MYRITAGLYPDQIQAASAIAGATIRKTTLIVENLDADSAVTTIEQIEEHLGSLVDVRWLNIAKQ